MAILPSSFRLFSRKAMSIRGGATTVLLSVWGIYVSLFLSFTLRVFIEIVNVAVLAALHKVAAGNKAFELIAASALRHPCYVVNGSGGDRKGKVIFVSGKVKINNESRGVQGLVGIKKVLFLDLEEITCGLFSMNNGDFLIGDCFWHGFNSFNFLFFIYIYIIQYFFIKNK